MGIADYQLFKQDNQIALCLGNTDYTKVLKENGKPKYANIEQADQDCETMTAGLTSLGFTRIDKMLNPTHTQLKLYFSELAVEMQKNHINGEKTLFFVYYSGHGKMDERCIVVLNEDKTFPLERKLRTLAIVESNYIIGLFDCCREKVRSQAMRGESASSSSSGDEGEQDGENYLFTFGCPPTEGVPSRSTVSRSYLRHLRKNCHPETGQIALPTGLTTYTGKDGKSESTIHVV